MKIKEKTDLLSSLHFEHIEWISTLEFWKDEIATFQSRLTEIDSKWTKRAVQRQVTHFRNAFIQQISMIDALLCEIRGQEQELAKSAQAAELPCPGARPVDIHANFREHMQDQRKVYQQLKKDFFAFLARTM